MSLPGPRGDRKQNLSLDCSPSGLFFMTESELLSVLVSVSVPLLQAAESNPERYDGRHTLHSVERRGLPRGKSRTHLNPKRQTQQSFSLSQSPTSCTGFPMGGELGGTTLLYLAHSPAR